VQHRIRRGSTPTLKIAVNGRRAAGAAARAALALATITLSWGCAAPTPAAGSADGSPMPAVASPSDTRDVGHNLALLDAYCWRLELNKNTDYTVLAKASEGGLSDATVYVDGTSWADVLRKAVAALEADMASKGITPEEAMAKNGGQTCSEAEIQTIRDRYNLIDGKAWYFKAIKTQGWTMTSKADIGGIGSVTAMGQGDTLIVALGDSLSKLDEEIATRKR
jgi:hypothetical protein